MWKRRSAAHNESGTTATDTTAGAAPAERTASAVAADTVVEATAAATSTESAVTPDADAPAPVQRGLLDPDEVTKRATDLAELIEVMRPAVQMDGGDLQVVDVDFDAGVVEVQLQGACGSCAISSTTLKGGVERLLMERLEWVTEVRGGVDESVDPFESAALGRGAYVPRYY